MEWQDIKELENERVQVFMRSGYNFTGTLVKIKEPAYNARLTLIDEEDGCMVIFYLSDIEAIKIFKKR